MASGYLALFKGLLSYLPLLWSLPFHFIFFILISTPITKLLTTCGFTQFENAIIDPFFKQKNELDKEYNNNKSGILEKQQINIKHDIYSQKKHFEKKILILKKNFNHSINSKTEELKNLTYNNLEKHQEKINNIETLLKTKTKKIVFSNNSKQYNIENLFKNYFKKHISKIDGEIFLHEVTNYLELNKIEISNKTCYKHLKIKLNKKEREDLICFLKFCKEKEIFAHPPYKNNTLNSSKTIALSLKENYPYLTESNETLRKDIDKKELVLTDFLRKDFNYYLTKQ
ncbi:hypothetical protein KUL113_64900 [Tenacibaculum sp. KUL113]|nr:hypothetical protein KUL113_64900 [Tenacibaculum sp. KUL113]